MIQITGVVEMRICEEGKVVILVMFHVEGLPPSHALICDADDLESRRMKRSKGRGAKI